jgi:hypothetical protein
VDSAIWLNQTCHIIDINNMGLQMENNTSNKTYGEVIFYALDPPSIEKASNAGWCAGFQEATKPDKYPHQDRCSEAFGEWINLIKK